jgi:subtilisin family serine protease
MAAPTDLQGNKPDPSKRPHVIGNSWGFFQKVEAFDQAIKSLHAAGVFVVFAAGNEGSRCKSLRHPGQNEEVFTVGAAATRSTNIVSFSSRGPAHTHNNAKPNIAAPGQSITSCANVGDGYRDMSGTSMATPAVVGGIAVVLSAKPHLKGDIAGIRKVMQDSANKIESSDCNSPSRHPNNVYGWGFMNLEKAVA